MDGLLLFVGLPVAATTLFALWSFTAVLDEPLAAVRRSVGVVPRFWTDRTRVIWADFDDDGYLAAFVYDTRRSTQRSVADEQLHWVRGWDSKRGVRWEKRARSTRDDTIHAAAGLVLLPYRSHLLNALDPRTGAVRWQVELPFRTVDEAYVADERVTYVGEKRSDGNDGWLRLDAATGTVVGTGGRRGAGAAVTRKKAAGCQLVHRASKTRRKQDDEIVLRLSAGADHSLGPGSGHAAIESVLPLAAGHYAVQVSRLRRQGEFRDVTVLVDTGRGRVVAELAPRRSWVLRPDGQQRRVRV